METLAEMAMDLVVLHEQIEQDRIRVAVGMAFETTPGDVRFCVRRLDVVAHVARTLGIKVVNNDMFAKVERVVSEMGWESVKNGGRSLYRCAKHKGQDADAALLVSRTNRH